MTVFLTLLVLLMAEQKKEYLTKRILYSRINKACKEASEDAMASVGFVVVAEEGWVVRKYPDGRIERIKPIDTVEQPKTIHLD